MKHFIRVATGLPVEAVVQQLAAHPELWDAHPIRKYATGTPHSQMSDIWVRYKDVAPHEASGDYTAFNDPHIPIWYPAWDLIPALKPIVQAVMAYVAGEILGGILITKIPPGGGIAPHTDHGWHAEYYDKFYIPIQNAPGATFWCSANGMTEGLTPTPGEVWYFNNQKRHWVDNRSEQDRIALILCIRTAIFGRI